MKQKVIAFILGIIVASPVMADAQAAALADSRATVAEFMQALKQALMAGMQDGGPVNAIGVCNEQAPAIAARYSVAGGRQVSRTSLRVRNPGNAPEDWERAVLEAFDARKQAGEAPAGIEYHEVVDTNGERELRYMKAIPTAELCLACHGENIDAAVSERIDALYPDDQARGYRAGDIRGAFTVTQPLAGGTDE